MMRSPSLSVVALIVMFVAVSTQTCVNQWSGVPSSGFMGIPSMMVPMPGTNCNILSEDITIQTSCTVKVSSNVTVQWYYTPHEADAGLNGTVLPFRNHDRTAVNSDCSLGEVSQCSSVLTISDVKVEDVGYYWCKVELNPTSTFVSRQSPVLRLTGCNRLDSCQKFSSYHTNRNTNFGCAVEDVSSQENDSITFVNFYDNCPFGPSLSTPKIEDFTPTMVKTSTMEAPKFMETTMSPMLSTITTVAATVVSPVNSDLVPGTDDGTSDSNLGLPLAIIWPIVGGGIGLMLFVVAVLLALILIVQCRRKRGKGEITPNNVVNQGYGMEVELESSTAPMVPRYRQSNQLQGYEDTTQLHDDIPSNFTLTASSSEHSPHTGSGTGGVTSPTEPPDQDLYDDVINTPLDATSRLRQAPSKHQYESVSAAEDGADYNQLLRSESAARNQNLSSSRLSGSPALASSESGSGLFDNPNYSQCKPLGTSNAHIDIYGLGSSDSHSGSGSQTRQQWVASSALGSHSESSGEDVSKFRIVDPTKSRSKRQISNSRLPPLSVDQYTHVLPETQEQKESDYAHRIVSSDEKYISEQGHVYQMLEKEEVSSGEHKLEDLSSKGSFTDDRFISNKGHVYHILENPAACGNQPPEDQQGEAVDQNHIYQILEEPTLTEDNEVLESQGSVSAHAVPSEADDAYSEPEYDVIESDKGQPPIAMRTNQSDYNVVERPEMHRTSSVVQQPEQHYNVTDRSTDHQPLLRGRSAASIQNRPNPYNVVERKISSSQLSGRVSHNLERSPPLDYSVLALDNSEKKDRKFKIEAHNPFYDVLDLDSVEASSGELHHTGSGPPVYNSLDTVSQQTLRNGIDNAIYHAVS